MKAFTAAAALFAVASATVAEKFDAYSKVTNGDAITIKENGQDKTVYVVGGGVHGNGRDYNLDWNGRGYLSNTPDLDPENFYRPNLLGGAIDLDVDISGKECGNVAAFYLVSMPGRNADGSYWQDTDGFYYCDANQVGGNFCPEYDIMEANKYAWQSTPHTCDAPNEAGFFGNCDKGGQCWQNSTEKLGGQYGPGGSVIDTNRSFHMRHNFNMSDNKLTSFETVLSQDGRTASMGSDCGYMGNMSYYLADGMAFAISNWGGEVSWLTKGSCYGGVVEAPLTYSNIEITLGTGSPDKPSPGGGGGDSGDYDFGDACATPYDDDCNGCGSCKWSWPKDDPAKWSSGSAHCRCQ